MAVCMDGAVAVTGLKSGVVSGIKTVNPKVMAMHSMLHQHALASKAIEADLCIVVTVLWRQFILLSQGHC